MRRTLGIVAALMFATAANGQVLSPNDADNGRIAGHVVTAYAELVADATVTLARVSDQGVNSRAKTMATDAGGAFSFTQLPPGRYRVFASKRGYTSRQLPSPADVSPSFELGSLVDLAADGQALDLQVVLHRTASIAGRIIRQDGSAAANVQVQLATRSDKGRVPLLEVRTTSEWDGRYEITGLPPGEYFVGAMNVGPPTPQQFTALALPAQQQFDASDDARGARNAAIAAVASAHTTWYPGVADPEPPTPVTLLEGINAEGIDIWLTPSQRFNVSGRVYWPVGVAVENITIDYGDPAGRRSGMWLVSDPGGLFTLSGMAPGALTLLVRAETNQGTLIGMASTEVSVDSVEDVRIVVDRPGVIAGRIVYEGNVPESARATSIVAVQKLLKVSSLYPVPEATVDSSGRFELAGTIGEYEFALNGLASNLATKRVTRNGRLLPMNRINVGAGDTISDLEIVVGQ